LAQKFSLTCGHAKDNIDAFNLMSILKRLHPHDIYLMGSV
jgi:hypothetical protein